jgi:transposase
MTKKKRGRTAYTDEFRREAVRLVEAQPDQLAQIARELGVAPDSLRSWRRRAQAQTVDQPIVRPAQVVSLEEENRRLRLENARLLEEREILKKATAFFAKDTR